MEMTFEKLPEAVSQLFEKLEIIEQLLLSKSNTPLPEADQLLTIKQAAAILHLSVPTVYGLVQRKEVPVCKRGNRLYFSHQELTGWIKSGRKKTNSEIEAAADAYISVKKNRRSF